MPWVKGQSGNPLGLTVDQRAAIENARKKTPWAIDRLSDLADPGMEGYDPRVAVTALGMLLKVGGLLDSGDTAKIEAAARAMIQEMLEAAKAQVAGETKQLTGVSESEPRS